MENVSSLIKDFWSQIKHSDYAGCLEFMDSTYEGPTVVMHGGVPLRGLSP